jgi:DNA polymerase-1
VAENGKFSEIHSFLKYNLKIPRTRILIEISKEHKINGKLEAIENDVTPIIQQLNTNGLPIDIDVVETVRNQYLEGQKACAEKIFSLVGSKFDLGKKNQIEAAFGQEGFKIGKRTNALVLESLIRKGSNFAALLKQYRQLQRIASNGQSLINFYDQFLRKLNPIWHQNRALTGRILSEGPCISNISKPYRASVREDGYQFIYFDFRNFELRIQASLSNDPVLIEMFNNNFDLHSFTASLILNKASSEIDDNERQKYKSISLGYWYGMGVDGIANRTGLQRNFVKNLTDTLDRKFKILRFRVTEYENEAKNKGYAETPWGRKMFKNAKRGYWALLAQATAADYFKYILVQVAEKLPELIISAPLFDGCLYKVKNDERKIKNSIGELNEIVTKKVEKFCKMAVDIGTGESWQEAVQNTFVFDNQ